MVVVVVVVVVVAVDKKDQLSPQVGVGDEAGGWARQLWSGAGMNSIEMWVRSRRNKEFVTDNWSFLARFWAETNKQDFNYLKMHTAKYCATWLYELMFKKNLISQNM